MPMRAAAHRVRDMEAAAPRTAPHVQAAPRARPRGTGPRRWRPALALAIACGPAFLAFARDTPPAPPDAPGVDVELAPVRVLGHRPPPDPFTLRNPVEVEDTVFSQRWDEAPSLEEVGLRGGYVQIAINEGLGALARGVRKLPGWRPQGVPAEARPPPLDAGQAERARALYEGPGAAPPH